jgi:hypothetical protein
MKVRLLVSLALLVFPASALASTHPVIPSGNSGANEYIETLPSASGQGRAEVRPPSNPHPASSGTSTVGSPALPTPVASSLARRGHDGRAAARFARATGPSGARHRDLPASVSQGGGPKPPAGSSPVSTVLGSLTGLSGGGGLGAALPIMLVLIAVWIAGLALRRRRTT